MLSCISNPSKTFSEERDKEKVLEILKILDSHTIDVDTQLSVYSDDVIHMGQGSPAISNLKDLKAMLIEERKWGHSEMKHEAYEIHSYEDHVIVRGGVTGTWFAKDGSTQMPFKTNNLITLKRTEDDELKVWHVIFNRIENQ
ncbi:hypothetical protein BFP71_10150 [Roseivirga misakiensis]|uniref:DUF4440 domain-containing protein n=2 Tax=Roseivirga misakiensis TaxID=1563681 RepID=A0A1E5SLA0_9BACT|nr:hypothetical protein BFP71_10150 [Roseivirga misakiensis]